MIFIKNLHDLLPNRKLTKDASSFLREPLAPVSWSRSDHVKIRKMNGPELYIQAIPLPLFLGSASRSANSSPSLQK
jgi:hypothetical protein